MMETFWEHEYNKHGTCYSTMKPSCCSSFLPPNYEWLSETGIVTSNSRTHSKSDIVTSLEAKTGVTRYISSDDNGALNEIWYFNQAKGPLVDE